MKQILVLIENELEQSITGVFCAPGWGLRRKSPSQPGRSRPSSSFRAERWISSLRMLNGLTWPTAIGHHGAKDGPDTPILVTSVGTQEEIAGYVWRLGVRDYLLKPYRPTWLLAAVRALVRKERSGGCAADQQEIYLRRLTEHLQRFQYKKCTDAAREYLDLLYQSTDNKGVIRTSAVRFAEGVAKAGIPFTGPPSGSCREVWSTFGSALTSRSGNMQPMSLLSGCWTRSLTP